MNKFKTFFAKTGLEIKKHEPEIDLILGITSFVATVILASRATLKADKILDEHENRIKKAEEAKKIVDNEENEEYDKYEYDIDEEKMKICAKTIVNIGKTYVLPVSVGALSIGFFMKSYTSLNGKFFGAVTFANSIANRFDDYRKHVIENEGYEADSKYMYGEDKSDILKEDKENPGSDLSLNVKDEYTIEFDDHLSVWDENNLFNRKYIAFIEMTVNDMLQGTKGYVFLNDIFEMIDEKPIPDGQIVGYTKADFPVSFGVSYANYKDNPGVVDFISGKVNHVTLKFKVRPIIQEL